MSDSTPPSKTSDLEELEPLPDLPAEAEGGGSGRTRTPRPAPGGLAPGELRELEQAPLHLRTAALIVVVASLFPWNGAGGAPLLSLAAKAVVLVGVYVWWTSVCLAAGEEKKVPGFLAGIGRANPKILWGLAGAIMVAGLLPLIDDGRLLRALTEKGILAWAAATWVHIYAYERGGKFNPLFPLMFFAPAIGGVIAALDRFRGEDYLYLGVIGAAGIALGGFLAVYTIVEAMKQAKSEGEAKRAEALAARRAGRKPGRKR